MSYISSFLSILFFFYEMKKKTYLGSKKSYVAKASVAVVLPPGL